MMNETHLILPIALEGAEEELEVCPSSEAIKAQ